MPEKIDMSEICRLCGVLYISLCLWVFRNNVMIGPLNVQVPIT
jgi:hypothetical protein